MNGFKIKKIQSLTLGEKMKKIREEKRISLADIAKNTKIQIEYLECLENGAYEKLPADVYVRGFLRSFAEYLGVDDEYLVKTFNKEKSIQENIRGNKQTKKYPEKINISRFTITPKIISFFFVSLFFLALSFYLYRNLDNFISTPELIIINPQADSIINDSSVVVKGKTDVGNELFINNQSVIVDDKGVFSENIVLKEGINSITIRSVNQFNKEQIKSISLEAHHDVKIEAEMRQEPLMPEKSEEEIKSQQATQELTEAEMATTDPAIAEVNPKKTKNNN